MNQSIPADRPLARIKSYVRREGRLTTSQQRALDALLPVYGIFPAAVECGDGANIDLTQLFGDTRPVVLEIGFGNGDLLASLARLYPYLGFIGAEVHRPGVGHLLNLVHTHGLTNVRVYNDDVMQLLDRLPLGGLQAIHLYYPDPWPKKKHNKRRLVTPAWLDNIKTRLRPGGVIHMATDWEDYAVQMLEVMDSNPDFANCAGTGHYHERPTWRPVTRFEQRGNRLGHGQWDLIHAYTPHANTPHANAPHARHR